LFNEDFKTKKENAFHIMRYEDMRREPFPVFVELFKFLFEVDSIEGTVCEKRLKELAFKGSNAGTTY